MHAEMAWGLWDGATGALTGVSARFARDGRGVDWEASRRFGMLLARLASTVVRKSAQLLLDFAFRKRDLRRWHGSISRHGSLFRVRSIGSSVMLAGTEMPLLAWREGTRRASQRAETYQGSPEPVIQRVQCCIAYQGFPDYPTLMTTQRVLIFTRVELQAT